MKKVAASIAVGLSLVALASSGTSAPASVEGDLACKPRGTKCHTSFECCSQNCQAVNGVEACH